MANQQCEECINREILNKYVDQDWGRWVIDDYCSKPGRRTDDWGWKANTCEDYKYNDEWYKE